MTVSNRREGGIIFFLNGVCLSDNAIKSYPNMVKGEKQQGTFCLKTRQLQYPMIAMLLTGSQGSLSEIFSTWTWILTHGMKMEWKPTIAMSFELDLYTQKTL